MKAQVPTKILLADDSQIVLRLAQCFLRTRYATITATSGEETFRLALAERPALIILDRHMPGWSEDTTLAALARDERTRNIPILVMTTEDHIASIRHGAGHLVKPFDATTLLGGVQECLSPRVARRVQARTFEPCSAAR